MLQKSQFQAEAPPWNFDWNFGQNDLEISTILETTLEFSTDVPNDGRRPLFFDEKWCLRMSYL